MEPRTFCDALNREAGDYLLATVLEGAAQGAQLLLCGGVPVWPEHPAACLEAQLPALQQVTASGVQTFGALRVFAERFGAAPRLVVCGGGHVGASVVRLAKLLGLPVCALEDRPEYAEQLRQAGADPVLCLPFEEGLAAVSGGAECYFVVVTRAHSCDVQCLTTILQKPAAYVGMMGSRGRAALVRRQLTEAGLDPARVEQLRAPIGLTIGAKTAEEIALSILADRGLPARYSGSIPGAANACGAGDHRVPPRLHAAGSRRQNAGPAGGQGRGQRGRRHHGIPHPAAGREDADRGGSARPIGRSHHRRHRR